MRKYFFTIVALCLGSIAFSQIAVRNEPRHHNVFENDYVRVLDVWLAPKDTTQFHIHATPSVFIMLTKTITSAQLMGQPPVRSTSVARTFWYDSLVTPRIHRVWNDDTTWFHVNDVELVAGKSHVDEPALQNNAIKLLFDEPLVRGYRVQLATTGRPSSAFIKSRLPFGEPWRSIGYIPVKRRCSKSPYESRALLLD